MLDELVAALGDDVVVVDPEVVDSYRFDRSNGPEPGRPLALVRARYTEDVQAALRWAAAHRVPVVPRGAGSGLSGGSTARRRRHRALPRADARDRDRPAGQVAAVEPGLRSTPRSRRPPREHGLWYPPDPSSFEICSIGGNVATNAGGLCCVKYGVTTDYVLGLDVVLADGTPVRLGGEADQGRRRAIASSLFVGSEGTLGVVTGAILRLVPPPAPRVDPGGHVPARATTPADAVVAIMGRRAPVGARADGPGRDQRGRGLQPMGLDRSRSALLLARPVATPAGD